MVLLKNDVIFDQRARIGGNVYVNGDAQMRIDDNWDLANSIFVAADIVFEMKPFSMSTEVVVLGNLNVDIQSIVDLGGGSSGYFDIANVILGNESQLLLTSTLYPATIGNLTLGFHNHVEFSPGIATAFTGTISVADDCKSWSYFRSNSPGVATEITLTSAQAVSSIICQDINCSTVNLTNTDGVDISNNTGITFLTATTTTTFYWVGSTTGNNKLGAASTGVNDDWSNPDNWSLTSGAYTGINTCIPGAQDNIVFDANSFTAGAGTVDLDLYLHGCNDMTWTNIPAGCTIDVNESNVNRELLILGDATLHANLDNQFEGTTTFSGSNTAARTITSNGSNFFGAVSFEFLAGNWSIADDFVMDGNSRADVTFVSGTVDANNIMWYIEDDWTVTGGIFNANMSTVEFDGPDSQSTRQEITSNGNSFYNLIVRRGTNGGGQNDLVRLLDPMAIINDLSIFKGGLEDNGNQITGSVIGGEMNISSSARIMIGKTGISTLFPTGYVTGDIDLKQNSHTRYNSSIDQTISSVPFYGRLYLINTNNPTYANKTINGLVNIKDYLFIDDNNNLVDDGFQITGSAGEEIQMETDSKLTIGSATSATQFPLNYTTFDINHESIVVYNSGVDQIIKSIAGTGDARYSHIEVTNSAGVGSPIKTLEGNVVIRGNLTINSNNEVDVSATNDYGIELEGNWINSGTFTAQEGVVSFTGSNPQSLSSGGSAEAFYNLVIDNSDVGGLIIEDDIGINSLLTFTDGVVYEGSGGNERIIFNLGADVSGASNVSHADGRVERIGSTAFEFPVGKNDKYRPISIGIPTVAGTGFRAEYFELNPDPTYDNTLLAPSIDHISSCEYWVLDRTFLSGNAVVKLSWETSSSCTVTDISELTVGRWDGSIWQDEGNGVVNGTVASGDISTGAAVSSFSPFTLASTTINNPLPINLLSFEANANGHDEVELKWITSSEINNHCFEIERSKDGYNFDLISKVKGAGNSSEELHYNLLDENPNLGISYYRLKQIDFDGDYTYSNTEIVKINRENELLVYPNPLNVKDNLKINTLGFRFDLGVVYIHNSAGKLIHIQKMSEGISWIKTNKLSPGNYILSVQLDHQIYKHKLILY